MVFYHGGGWCIGDIDTHDEPCRQLAKQSGATVVSPDYRLGPEHRFPAAIDDSYAVLQWVADNKDRLGGPDAKIAVCGDSAGSNIAAVMALMARDNDGPAIASQLLVYPATDLRMADHQSLIDNGEGYLLTKASMDWFKANYLNNDDEANDWCVSPLLAADHTGLPPALIITAEFDPLRDEGTAYAETLRAAGNDVTHTNYDGMVHVFFQLGPLVPAGASAVSEVAAAARAALGG
ncbi:MAG: alpha/beta hydrolase [Acidimicrobiales bacterium]